MVKRTLEEMASKEDNKMHDAVVDHNDPMVSNPFEYMLLDFIV